MTAPAQPPPQLEQFLVHAAELYALEQLAARTVVGPLRKQVQGVWRAAAALWVTMFGSLDSRASRERQGEFLAAVKRDIAAIRPDVAGPLAEFADRALALGVQHAADEVGVRVVPPGEGTPVPLRRRPATLDRIDWPTTSEPSPAPRRLGRSNRVDWPTTEQPTPAPRRPGHGERRDWPTVDLDPVLSDETTALIGTLDRHLTEQLLHAEHAVEQVTGDTYQDVTDALTETQKTVTAADRATTVVVNEAANAGSDQLAEKLGAERLWIAERDACVHCLAYAGQIAPVGGSFPVGLTFGDKPLVPWPDPHVLPGCPLHPHCRCRTTPWLGSVPGYDGPDLPAVLKREAQRSILTGWRVESESERARLRAADRLLRRGTTLPKSVQQRARTAVKRGRFNPFPRCKKGSPP